MCWYYILFFAILQRISASVEVCNSQRYKQLDHEYLPKDVSMCGLFIQSFADSIDVDMSPKNYLLKYIPYAFLRHGHLHSFTQFSSNYTFLLASAVDQHDESHRNNYAHTEKIQLDYISIDWSKSPSEILDEIINKFQITTSCNATITLYLTFPSYPKENSLSRFFRDFEKRRNQPSIPIANVNHTNYSQYVHPSFSYFVDLLPLDIFQQLLQNSQNLRIVMCGHGLGGAIAQLSTLHLLLNRNDLHFTQLRSISLGSLFFATEELTNHVKEHNFDQHFINIYHQMDVIPSLFNVAQLLSESLNKLQPKKFFFDYVKSMFVGIRETVFGHAKNSGTAYYTCLKALLGTLFQNLVKSNSSISLEAFCPLTIDKSLRTFNDLFNSIQNLLSQESTPKLIYQPLGIYTVITARQFDNTWDLICVSNKTSLHDHLSKDIEHSKGFREVFKDHSISSYLTDLQQCNQNKPNLQQQKTLSDFIELLSTNKYSKDSNTNADLHLNSNFPVSINLPLRFTNHLHDQYRSEASYMSMIAVPPATMSRTNDLSQNFLSAIKYRTGLSNLYRKNKQAKMKKRQDDMNLYGACLAIYEKYNLDARMELMKLQLDQRILIPILVSNLESNSLPFRSYIETLKLIETDVFQGKDIRLAYDETLLRVGIVSTIQGKIGGLPNLIQDVFQTASIRHSISGAKGEIKHGTILEAGYGFLPDSNSPSRYQPVILAHIIGDYQQLLSFLVQYVDVLIIEHDEDNKNYAELKYNPAFNLLRFKRIIQWKYTTEASFEEVISTENPFSKYVLEGTSNAIKTELQALLLEILHSNVHYSAGSNRPSLGTVNIDRDLFQFDDIPFLDVQNLFHSINTAEVRQKQFQLQESYQKEAPLQSELHNPALQLNDDRRKQLHAQIHHEIELRRNLTRDTIRRSSILQAYLSILSETSDEKRYIHKRQFELALAELNDKEIIPLRQERDRTFKTMTDAIKDALLIAENDKDYSNFQRIKQQAISKHYEVKQNLISASLSIEHFWREISHLYVADKIQYQQLPKFAAQHLMDGFSLELLDGHSMLLNKHWIKSVFDALNDKLHQELNRPAKILVLSICGPQSSGKSTLLKTMFGIRVRASVGACTQGVNMMLVKVRHQHFDYMILLDTEGIRAPDFSFLPDANVRDNTLASFAVLPADGTILLNKGEVNQALEDVLPIVLYLYATSSLSLQLGGRIQSKLFFVYNQIDPGQREKGTELLQNLNSRLLNMTNHIREALLSQNITLHGFELCQLDLENRSNSDFRILSTNTDRPPINLPVDLFGEESLELRHWIERRISNETSTKQWEPRSIHEIYEYIEIVGDTIRRAPHIASVNSPLEMLEIKKLNEKIESIKYNISLNYTASRNQVEKETIQKYMKDIDSVTRLRESWKEVDDIITEAHKKVLELMNETISFAGKKMYQLAQGSRREGDIIEVWKLFLEEKSYVNRQFLRTRIDQEIAVTFLINVVEEKIRDDFISICNQINCASLHENEAEKEKIFNEILENRTKQFQDLDQSNLPNVEKEIRQVYNRSNVIESVTIFNEQDFCQPKGKFSRTISEEKKIQHVENFESDSERRDRQSRLQAEDRKFRESLQNSKEFIDNLVTDHTRYDSFIVNKVLQHIGEIIKMNSIKISETVADLHRGTYCYLTDKLTQLQNKWNDEHDSRKHVEKHRDRLWSFFSNVVKGIVGIKLFEVELYNQINDTWKEGFFESLIQDMKTKVGTKHWIRNHEILADFVDNEKIEILNEAEDGSGGNIMRLLTELQLGSEFHEKCVNKFAQKEINDSVNSVWTEFYNTIIDAIDKAGREAKDSPKDLLEVFLKTLRSQSLPSSIKNQLPLTSKSFGNVDDQPRHIFDEVSKKLKSVVPTLTSPIKLLNGNESKIVLEKIRDDAPNDDAKPRCNHACKLCGAPCFRHNGHNGHHDFYHQPGGLAGMRWNLTHLIVHETCHESYLRKNRFSIDYNEWHTYDEFPTFFDYSVPSAPSRRNELSEYLMYKYHEEIAKFYGIKPNPPVPAAFNHHNLASIKEEIRKRIHNRI